LTLIIKRVDTLITCGIAGIGHLGEALAQQLEGIDVHVCAHHPNLQRRTEFSERFKKVKAVDFSELLKQPIVLLALPAEAIQPFLKNAKKEILSSKITKPTFVNLSTLVDTKALQNEFSDFKIYGVKMVGHANYLYEHGDGVFVTETPLNTEGFQKIRFLFENIGILFEDNEDVVRKVNGLAVRKIIEACVNFKKETENYPDEYSEKAMDTIFPNTMRLYREGSFDGFMLKIIDGINLGNK
jgi:pyrroline-5-carboxylate reductase